MRHPRLVGSLAVVFALSFASYWPFRPTLPAADAPPAAHLPTPLPAPPPPATAAFATPSAAALEPLPATTALIEWATRHLAAPHATARDALLAEGVALARVRRPLLAELIRTDPEAALAAGIPRGLRARLPASILAELEQPVSARAELSLIQTCFHPPGTAHDPAEHLHRATVIDDREYRAHVYGSRLRDGSLRSTSIIGVALDGHLAVADSRLRVLEPGEPTPADARRFTATASSSGPALAVEADGRVTLLASAAELPAFRATLLAAEENPLVDEADSGPGSSTVTGRPSHSWTHGEKDLLVIRVDFSDLPGEPVNKFDGNATLTPAYIHNVINGATGVRAFLRHGSYGKSDLIFDSATDLTPVLRLPGTASSYATAGTNALLHSHARTAADAAGFAVSTYDRVAVVFSYLGDIPGSSITYGGLANIAGSNLWINGSFDLRVVGHELGHTYGLRHANLWRSADGNPVSLSSASSVEYGDPFDLMGGGGGFAHDFSHWNKSLLQWIPDSAVTVAATGGTYRVHRFDASAADLSAPRALKIVRDTARDYWIGYRRATASAFADNGAYVLWGYNTSTSGDLLDLVTPAADAADAPLPLHTTFTDHAAGISLRPVAQGGSGADEWIDIQVTMQPRIQWAATSYVANEQGGAVTLSVHRTANSAGAVGVSYATLSGTAASGADFTPVSGTLLWPDGDTTPRTVAVPIVADALAEGTETFVVTLHSPSGGVIVPPADATVIIADPGARDPAFAAHFINSTVNRVLALPDGKLLVAGWFDTLQDTAFNLYPFGRVARLTATGAIDPDFDPGTGANGAIHALARQADGKILVGGAFTSSASGIARDRIARLHPDGSLDTTFRVPSRPSDTIHAILPLPDGRILVGGAFTQIDGVARRYVARLHADGALDASFTGPDFFAGSSGWFVRALAIQPDGKILVGGAFYHPTGQLRASLRRLEADGSEDGTFNGLASGASAAFDPRYLGTVHAISLAPDGRILIAGDFSQFNGVARAGIARLTSTGALDPDFAPALDHPARALLPLPDGRLLLAGTFTSVGGSPAARLALLRADGTLDTAFAAAGGHAGDVQHLALQPDGNVVLAGAFAAFQGATPERPVWRLVPGLPGLPGVLRFAADAATAIEGATATLGVTRTGGSLGALTVGYSTVAGTATAGADYTTTAGTLTWADGDSSAKMIAVPVALDSLPDTPETFTVNLGAPLVGGALLGDRQQNTVTITTAFSAWLGSHFSPSELADPAIGGDSADPDGDGLDNLAEFALGRSPRVADASSAWTTGVQNIGGADHLTITFRRRAPALDLAYAVQSSSDLAPGSWIADAVQAGTALDHGDGTETVTFRDSRPASPAAPRRFLRVHVTRTP